MDFSKHAKRFGIDPEKIGSTLGKFGFGPKDPLLADERPEKEKASKAAEDTSSSILKVLTGTPSIIEEYYFPTELIGGTCPRVAGEEEEIVWNAAAEACDTERVHVVWQSVENRIWYLAVKSSELASHPNSWCPFAALLPGVKDAPPPPICYTYYGDETATMIMITSDGLQIYRGTNPVVRAKAERSARELGDAPLIDLVPDKILKLTPVPWYSLSLFEDRARRILAAAAILSALAVAGIAMMMWLLGSMSLISARHDLSEALARTQNKTAELMQTVEKLRASPMREQLSKFAEINDALLNLNGLLEVYEVKDGKVRWRAVIPANITADRIAALAGKSIETVPQGIAIGNAAQIEYEAANPGKK